MTIVAALWTGAARHPDKIAFRSLGSDIGVEAALTYGQLAARVAALAGEFLDRGLGGARVGLLQSQPMDFLVTFLAVLATGGTAVPLNSRLALNPQLGLDAIIRDAKLAVLFAEPDLISRSVRRCPTIAPCLQPSPRWDGAVENHGFSGQLPADHDVAVIQYTSGSTSSPKGVQITHRNFLSNADLLTRTFSLTDSEVSVIWLPLYHDMGLMTGIVWPLVGGGTSVLMSPSTFSARPLTWLHALARYGGTASSAPNFAYQACADKITLEDAAALDLSQWRTAICGSEPIRPSTLEAFSRALAPAGFRAESLFPSYGLAEATLFVSGGRRSGVPQAASLEGDVRVTSCGEVGDGLCLEIVDPVTHVRLGDGDIGEIWLQGPSISSGYVNNQDANREVFGARLAGDQAAQGFLRTGDLGFRREGQLFVTGRLKDLLIVRGSKHWPQDIEFTAAGADPALIGGRGAAFAVERGDTDAPDIILVQECERAGIQRAPDIAAAVRGEVARVHGISLARVLLVRRGALPVTSSGKVRRQPTRQAYLEGRLDALGSGAPASGKVDRPMAAHHDS